MIILMVLFLIVEICLIIFIFWINKVLNNGEKEIDSGRYKLRKYSTGVNGLLADIFSPGEVSNGRIKLREGEDKLRIGYILKWIAIIFSSVFPLILLYLVMF